VPLCFRRACAGPRSAVSGAPGDLRPQDGLGRGSGAGEAPHPL